jgi:hypothetical protein
MEEIFKAPITRLITFAVALVTAISPGMMFLALFEPAFFAAADGYKLTTIAAAISLPMIAINGLLLWALITVDEDDASQFEEREHLRTIAFGCGVSLLPIYFPCVLRVLTRWGTVRSATWMALATEAMVIVAFLTGIIWGGANKPAKATPTDNG